jgi:two-component system chemotaxis response regulator CheY
MKILVVDDSKVMRAIVRRTLRQAGFGGHDVQEASNGKEGLDLVKSFVPDVILCDWNMPEMNGIDMLRTLRSEGNTTTFGFVTSEGTPEMRGIAESAGALFLITKPFTSEDFEAILGPVLAKAA